MGAAGDMLAGALLELTGDPDGFIREMNEIGLAGVSIAKENSFKCGIGGTHFRVTVNGEEEISMDVSGIEHHHDHGHHHIHRGPDDIEHIVREHMSLPEKVKQDIVNVYGMIAEAESAAHKVPVNQIHFHEVGAMDALADITAVCLLMYMISPDKVIATPVRTGYGSVRCAHGVLPVPAPATAYILKDIPAYGGDIEGELCTPTGAALLRYYVTEFGQMPAMTVSAVGYGMGNKDFERANCIRAMIGSQNTGGTEEVTELSCNVDDMTAEEIGFAIERILSEGAKEVFSVPVTMKKSRPGSLLCVICDNDIRDKMVRAIFRYTSTIGIRQTDHRRFVLDREITRTDTPYGPVRVKKSQGYGVTRIKYEYDDLAAIAAENGLSIDEVRGKCEKSDKGGSQNRSNIIK